jgi:hypothetical protein
MLRASGYGELGLELETWRALALTHARVEGRDDHRAQVARRCGE